MRNATRNYFALEGKSVYFEVCLYLFVASLPFGYGLDALLLALLTVLWFFVSDWKEKVHNLRKHQISLFLILALHILIWVGMIYSDSLKVAFGRVERSLALIILPIIVFSLDKRFFNLRNIFYALGLGLLIVMLVSWTSILVDILSKPWPMRQAKYFFEWIYTDDNLLKAIDIHPGYFVLFLVLFFSVLVNGSMFNTLRDKKIWYPLALAFSLLFLVETSSRVGFVCLVLILVINAFRKSEKRMRWLHLGILFSLLLIATQFEYLQSKFEMLIDKDGRIGFERYYRWREIVRVFSSQQGWIFGVGSGDVYDIYRTAYEDGGFSLALKESYNAHNQYLELLVSNGLTGLFLYMTVLINFVIKTKLKETALAFIVLIVVFSFSESFLVRSKGVFFFAFFYALFINTYYPDNQDAQ